MSLYKQENRMENKAENIKSARINKVLGIFILFFGGVILISIYFTETYIGQITNLVAGIILILIGGGMLIQSINKLKRLAE
jgi:putative Mn2+ efflux pump MntP